MEFTVTSLCSCPSVRLLFIGAHRHVLRSSAPIATFVVHRRPSPRSSFIGAHRHVLHSSAPIASFFIHRRPSPRCSFIGSFWVLWIGHHRRNRKGHVLGIWFSDGVHGIVLFYSLLSRLCFTYSEHSCLDYHFVDFILAPLCRSSLCGFHISATLYRFVRLLYSWISY